MLPIGKDLNIKILLDLNDKDLINMSQISKQMYNLCTSDYFWRLRINHIFPFLEKKLTNREKKYRTWSRYYAKLVKYKNMNPDELLEYSSIKGRMDGVMMALHYGADITNDNTSLQCASENEHLEIVEILIEQKINVDENGVEALTAAIRNGSISIIKLLVNSGVNINNVPIDDIARAIIHYDTDLAKLLLTEYTIDVSDTIDEILFDVCEFCSESSDERRSETVRILLEFGADPNAFDTMALRCVSGKGCTHTAKILLNFGADVHANCDESLLLSVTNGHTSTVKLLLKHGADIRIGANIHIIGDEALKTASKKGNIDIAKLLLENGWSFNFGSQPLLHAIDNGDINMAKLLLIHGADVQSNNAALRLAITKGYIDIVKLLLEFGANSSGLVL